MDDGPIIGASGPGVALTVTIVAMVHPLVAVKVITEVPGAMPVIAPDAVAVATRWLLLVHDTVGMVASVRKVTDPVQTVRVPLIGAGRGFTVTTDIL